MKQSIRDLIYLAACDVNSIIPDKARVEQMNMEELETAASFHKMDAIAAYALAAAGIELPFCTEAIDGETRKEILWSFERQTVFDALNREKIWYMPLKGAILKDLYPKIGMRQMSDTDILFDKKRADDVREIMESLGYETIHFGEGHQDDYQKEPFFHFEMHRVLFSEAEGEVFYAYYQEIEMRLLPGDGFERCFSSEDFYVYMIAHAYKHYTWQGIGLRSLLDVYVYLTKHQKDLDWAYIHGELERLELVTYESQTRCLAEKVFRVNGLQGLSAEEENSLNIYARSGMYGTEERHIQIMAEQAGRFSYILQRVFLPMPKVEQFYPFFYRHRVLLPVLPLYRLIRGSKNAKKEWNALHKKHE